MMVLVRQSTNRWRKNRINPGQPDVPGRADLVPENVSGALGLFLLTDENGPNFFGRPKPSEFSGQIFISPFSLPFFLAVVSATGDPDKRPRPEGRCGRVQAGVGQGFRAAAGRPARPARPAAAVVVTHAQVVTPSTALCSPAAPPSLRQAAAAAHAAAAHAVQVCSK